MRALAPWYYYVAQLWGLGRLPGAPGTWGSLGAVAVFIPLQMFCPEPALSVVVVAVVLLSFPICNWASAYMGQWDPDNVVYDELAGQWLALWPMVWLEFWPNPWWGFLAGFFLFRFFDIIKIFPANRFDRMENGYGITLDDIMAGIYANLCLTGIGFWLL